MKLLLSSDDKSAIILNTESIWKSSGFFGDQKGEFTINKASFLENIYTNQGSISTVKGGDYAFYLDYVILVQLICAKNLPEDFDNCKANQMRLICVCLSTMLKQESLSALKIG